MMEGECELSSIWHQTPGASGFLLAIAMMIILQPMQDTEEEKGEEKTPQSNRKCGQEEIQS